MTPTPELREEVARALTPVLIGSREDWYGRPLPEKSFDDLTPEWQERHMQYADAAIAAVLAWVDREFVAIERLT